MASRRPVSPVTNCYRLFQLRKPRHSSQSKFAHGFAQRKAGGSVLPRAPESQPPEQVVRSRANTIFAFLQRQYLSTGGNQRVQIIRVITVPERITNAGKVELWPLAPDCVLDLFEAVEESRRELSTSMHWCHPDYSIDDTRQWVSSRATAWEQGDSYSFLIMDARAKQVLGTCGIDCIHPVHRFGNLGYWIRTSRIREGAATEATGLLAKFGFLELQLMRIEIVVAVGNLASQKVAQKVGAVREGRLRNRVNSGGEFRDAYMFSLVPPLRR